MLTLSTCIDTAGRQVAGRDSADAARAAGQGPARFAGEHIDRCMR